MSWLQDKKVFAVLATFWFLCLSQAYIIQSDPEELWHFIPDTWEESWYSIKMSYLCWNARIGELACYLVGDHFRAWVVVLHPVCLTLAVISLYRLAAGVWPWKERGAGLVLFFIIVAVCGLHSGLDWFISNCNWLYPCSVALFFFAMTERFFKGDFSMGWGRVLLLLPLAVIIGMSNENTSLVSLVFFGGVGVYWKWKAKAKWSGAYIVLLLTLLAAALVFYCAPARAARSADAGWEFSIANILHNCVKFSDWGYFFICFSRPFVILAVLLLWKPRMNKVLLQPRFLLVGLAFFMMWGILILSPCWGAPRAYCPMEMLLIVLMAALFREKAADSWCVSRVGVLLVQGCVMATIIWPMCVVDWARYEAWCHVEELAEQARADGKDVLVITRADVDVQAQPVSRLWQIPHSFYPYKTSVGYLAIPGPVDKAVDYFERTLPQWREAEFNRPQARRLGLKELRWEKTPDSE